jgi:hypothetical protein
MTTLADIPYPSGTGGISVDAGKVARGVLNRIASMGGLVLRRAGGVVTGVLWPSPLADATPFGVVASLLQPDQVRWVNDVAGATGASNLHLGQHLVDQLAVWEHANPGVAPPKELYDDAIAHAQAIAAPASGPTPNNVRISRILAATLGACAALACTPPYQGGAHACTSQPPGDGMDSHHMPADSATPLPRAMGPAIKMSPSDHWQTDSYGGGATGPGYAARRALIAAGQGYRAFQMDAQEIRTKFPGKYDAGLAQAEAYAACLHAHGLL